MLVYYIWYKQQFNLLASLKNVHSLLRFFFSRRGDGGGWSKTNVRWGGSQNEQKQGIAHWQIWVNVLFECSLSMTDMVLISGFSICYICEKTKFVYISIDKFSRYTVQSLVFRNFRFYTYFRKFTRQYFISLYLSKQYLAIKVFGMIAYFVDAFVHKTDFNRVWPRNRVATP